MPGQLFDDTVTRQNGCEERASIALCFSVVNCYAWFSVSAVVDFDMF
jgi:hypothetical protein